ncbi:MAG: ferritin-like domain-containing protein, partial [Rudanella sp.]|nr:ferritin-like domain-containing protein [Rudanella sp.]
MENTTKDRPVQSADRRLFLRYAGVATGALLIQSCVDKDSMTTPLPGTGVTTVDLGTGDVGILNYAYALEQLEAAFYTQVIATPYTG